MDNLVISFSGGKSSAFMAKWMLENKRHEYDAVITLFANTGQEHERTLEFVDRCDKAFNLNLVWVEAVTHHGERRGCTHKVTNFADADRSGSVYSDMVSKYGIPNKKYPHCTRELKLNPIKSYLRSIGWKKGEYDTAIGLRGDEVHRISSSVGEERILYPLMEYINVDKQFINDWWSKQDFTLDLPEHLGNCTWCWKKSDKKLARVYRDDPNIFNVPLALEKRYGRYDDGKERFFFRGNESTAHMLDRFSSTVVVDDTPNGCSDSCEVFN